jgi:hypothetical protein
VGCDGCGKLLPGDSGARSLTCQLSGMYSCCQSERGILRTRGWTEHSGQAEDQAKGARSGAFSSNRVIFTAGIGHSLALPGGLDPAQPPHNFLTEPYSRIHQQRRAHARRELVRVPTHSRPWMRYGVSAGVYREMRRALSRHVQSAPPRVPAWKVSRSDWGWCKHSKL